ncbi:MAG: glycosyltransferase family 4 protein [Nitrococcus sp.]|nr:glycosyltransferase family 4 protein [Nitrococcus sp.]
MRILFFSDHFKPEPSAPAAHVYERAKIWVDNGHDVTVICAAPNFPEGEVYKGYKNVWRHVEYMEGIRVVRVKTYITKNEGTVRRILDYASYAVSSFVNSLFEKKADVIISTSPHLFVPLGGVLSSLVRCVPHVFEIRDLWPAAISAVTNLGRGKIYRFLERLEVWLYRRSTRVIAFTPYFKKDLVRRGIPEDKIDVVINGANLGLFGPQKNKDLTLVQELTIADFFVVGFLGTLGLSQGLENVVEVAELLKEEQITFLFVGVGAAKDKLVRMAIDRRLDNVVFVPRQPKEEMPRFWSVCDVSLVHLKNDPIFSTVIPSKIFESMACGKAIAYVGPEGEGSRIVEECDVGIVVPPDSPELLAAALKRLRSNHRMRRRFEENGIALAPLFSRENQAANTLMVLAAAAGQRAGEQEVGTP